MPVEPLVIRGEVLARPDPEPAAESEFAEVHRLLLCPACRSGNPETRQYCQPCGGLLRPVPEPPEPTRWQRLREQHLERPDVWHFDRRWLTVLIALPLCFAVGTAAVRAVNAGEEALPWVKDRFAGQSSVAADSVEASSEAKGFDAKLAADGVDNRAWAPAGQPADAVGHAWTATFQHPFRLTTLSLISGVSPKPKEYLQTGRPTKVTVTATTTQGRTVRKSLTLFDQPGPQRFALGIDGVVSVEIRIDAVRSGLKPKAPIALAEVQFFTRRTT
ncbi:NADase-type glycan-binding domain-containing protein [Streptomyces sp. NPDC058579]|uniref:NADase-type glycan-binding domain-containing protein n=1 Tax=Streptomyces sp. NPDC058579 TaxID=3346548 RepID=UPI0036692162